MSILHLALVAILSASSLLAADGTLSARSLVWQGTTRTYNVWIPDSVIASSAVRHPIVVVLHGGGGSAASIRNTVKNVMEPLAARDAWLIVYPDAVNGNWNDDRPFLVQTTTEEDAANAAIDDIGCIDAIADALAADPQLRGDSARLFATGFSNGAYMAQTLVRAMGDRIAAAAPVASAFIATNSTPGLVYTASPQPTPLICFGGTADAFVPYDGGMFTKGALSFSSDPTATAIAWWAAFNTAATPPSIVSLPDLAPADGSTVERHVHAQPASGDGHAVHLYKIIGGGHAWPGSGGIANMDIDASALIWDFFLMHGRVVPPQATVAAGGARPTWTWSPGHSVGGAGVFRFALDGAPLQAAPETTATLFTPPADLGDGTHTLRVQERNAFGTWSTPASASISINLEPPAGTDGGGAGGGGGCGLGSAGGILLALTAMRLRRRR